MAVSFSSGRLIVAFGLTKCVFFWGGGGLQLKNAEQNRETLGSHRRCTKEGRYVRDVNMLLKVKKITGKKFQRQSFPVWWGGSQGMETCMSTFIIMYVTLQTTL